LGQKYFVFLLGPHSHIKSEQQICKENLGFSLKKKYSFKKPEMLEKVQTQGLTIFLKLNAQF